MFLCIDAGNTRTKAAVYNEEGNLIELLIAAENDLAPIHALSGRHPINHAIVSTTGERSWSIEQLEIKGKKIELTHQTPMPVKLVYSTAATLGRDRIAAACGANALYPGKNCLVVSVGTCMTMDIVLEKGIFLGGNIAPGLKMRLQSMHEYTARLPLVEPGWPEIPFGDSTIHALQNGACLGMVMEIEGIFQRAKDAFGEVFVVMTGGDAAFLAEQIESQIFVAPELVTQGLFQILAFNV
ncbi:MAG TPA: type III pantothenate kinase [Saprospiraceae bacterium]